MQMLIPIDLSELFESVQTEAIESADIDGDYESGNYISGFDEITLKDSVINSIVSQCSHSVDRSAISQAVMRLSLDPGSLSRKFDSIAKQNISESIDRKVEEWVAKSDVSVEDDILSADEYINKQVQSAVEGLNKNYGTSSFSQSINKMVEVRVSEILKGYETQIKKDVDLVAQSIIQQKVSETLTETFVNLMKQPNSLKITGE